MSWDNPMLDALEAAQSDITSLRSRVAQLEEQLARAERERDAYKSAAEKHFRDMRAARTERDEAWRRYDEQLFPTAAEIRPKLIEAEQRIAELEAAIREHDHRLGDPERAKSVWNDLTTARYSALAARVGSAERRERALRGRVEAVADEAERITSGGGRDAKHLGAMLRAALARENEGGTMAKREIAPTLRALVLSDGDRLATAYPEDSGRAGPGPGKGQ